MCTVVLVHDKHSSNPGSTPSPFSIRRNSVPPIQTAEHLLAYLPRSLHSVRYAPYTNQEPVTSAMATVPETRRESLILSLSTHQDKGGPLLCPSPSESTSVLNHSTQDSATLHPPACVPLQSAPQEPQEKPLKNKRPQRGRHLKRFSSKWRSGDPVDSSGGGGHPVFTSRAAVDSPSEATHKKRRHLLCHRRPVSGGGGNRRQRYVSKDGKCRVNLGPIEDKTRFLSDIFTTLVDLQYRWFLFLFTMCYILTWVAFAAIYLLDAWLRDDVAHAHDPDRKPCFQNVDSFLSALLLSLESQRTIGYGSRMVTAHCPEGVVLLMAQSILGSIIDALMVGCMFVKISRPQKRAQTLIFSKRCVISERDERLCLLFRIGDLRASHMVDAKIRAKLIKSRQTQEGEFIPLEQSEINLGYDTGGDRLLLVEPQTITHVIDHRSPFWEVGAERLTRETLEIIVILEGIVEASGMTCQARTSYTENEILWGHRFESCMSLEKGAFRVDYGAFDKTFEVQMSPISAKERKAAKDQEGELH
ncbi:G protein-activated inward rectifier potassium channel 3-like [Gadus macrocephalus]|uniref:G protein-activated inward rectifier potassium channel 3-like n=1 Tax=Gadus macrocephalus TaxID=80720 RepID=UPI0028CB1A66|nr:G protein-activated inward rectifier potassium channel 3-like [Gadus macrocephalus]XP_059912361.1 G protein-activated inward rectifier potassium channel 3-like [Gadus macrocephalus]